jgi:hypothetical protein
MLCGLSSATMANGRGDGTAVSAAKARLEQRHEKTNRLMEMSGFMILLFRFRHERSEKPRHGKPCGTIGTRLAHLDLRPCPIKMVFEVDAVPTLR